MGQKSKLLILTSKLVNETEKIGRNRDQLRAQCNRVWDYFALCRKTEITMGVLGPAVVSVTRSKPTGFTMEYWGGVLCGVL